MPSIPPALFTAAAIATLFAPTSHVSAGIVALSANLEGLQEVPPNASPAFGTADAALDSTTGTFTITLGTFQDLLGGNTGGSLNDAAPGSNGPTIISLTTAPLGGTTGTFSGGGTLTPSQITDMLAGNTYLNIRSTVFPSGEIRGQLAVTPEPVSLALLTPTLLPLLKRRRKIAT